MENRAVLGIFEDATTASEATGQLLDNGFSGRDFDILSSSPYPDGAFGEEESIHHIYVFPLVGALCGFITGFLITSGTQLAVPLVTGGKPILAIPPMLIIMYEGTMLGAIIFTFLGVLFESRLPSSGPRIYDRRITEGYIGVVVQGNDGRVDTAARVMREHGAEDVRYDDESDYVT